MCNKFFRRGLAGVVVLSAMATALGSPGAAISGASVVDPVCVGYPAEGTATASGTFDSNSTTGPTFSSFTASSGTIGSSSYTRIRTRTVTDNVYSAKNVSLSIGGNAASSFGVGPGTLVQPLTPTAGDGVKSATFVATASETLTSTQHVYTEYWTGNGQGTGGQSVKVGETGPVDSTSTSTLSNSTSLTLNYVVDLDGPTAVAYPNGGGAATTRSGQHKQIHVRIFDGSAGQSYSVVATATFDGDANTWFQGSDNGSFGPSNDGIWAVENSTFALAIPCSAPLGLYHLKFDVYSKDLRGNASYVTTLNGPDFTVTSGLDMGAQTVVVTDLGGQYGLTDTFTAGGNRKSGIKTNPGSFHVTSTLTTTGPCAGFGSYTPTAVSFTLPKDFSWTDTGNSPTVHMFTGIETGGAFDYHYPVDFTEIPVTISSSVVNPDGSTTYYLALNLGTIPSDQVVYLRGHVKFTGLNKPNAGSTFTFSSSATSDVGVSSSTATLTCSG